MKKRIAICIRLPADVATTLDLLLQDELGRVRYGAKQRLIESLVRDWIRKQRDGGDIGPRL